jgi:hypothetical protein
MLTCKRGSFYQLCKSNTFFNSLKLYLHHSCVVVAISYGGTLCDEYDKITIRVHWDLDSEPELDELAWKVALRNPTTVTEQAAAVEAVEAVDVYLKVAHAYDSHHCSCTMFDVVDVHSY